MLIEPKGRTFNDNTGQACGAANLDGPMRDPICNVKSVANLKSEGPHEDFRTEMGKWFEERREQPLMSLFDLQASNDPLHQQAQKFQQR
jgi:hypothetical protein